MTRHEQTVADLCKSRHLERMGFRQAVRRELAYDPPDVEAMDDAAIALLPPPPEGKFPWCDVEANLRIRPDAYAIRNGEIHCYEIEDKSPVTDKKRVEYAEAWYALDNFHIRFRLWIADLYGNVHEFTIANWFYLLAVPRGNDGPDGVQAPDDTAGMA